MRISDWSSDVCSSDLPSSWHEIVSGAPRAPVEQGAQMSVLSSSDVYYDPYDTGIHADPYPAFARLRDEAPLYYNEPHDFFALSRYEDVERSLVDRDKIGRAHV